MSPKTSCNQHPVQPRLILKHFCNKWAVPVLEKLEVYPTQFGELRRGVQGISQRMLTMTLRELDDDFLIVRNVLPTESQQLFFIKKTILYAPILRAIWPNLKEQVTSVK